ncbi:D-amino acid dehydrogenase small subunit, partial [Durusdinium trenchii]
MGTDQPTSCQTLAKNLEKVIHLPLEYDVLRDCEGPPVFLAPTSTAEHVGRLPEGTIQGYPAGEWLHIFGQEISRLKGQGFLDGDFQDGWVYLGSSAERAERPAPRWSQIEVEMVYLEALEFSWPGIPAEFVTYSVQWRKDRRGFGEHGMEEEDGPTADGSNRPEDERKSGAIECTSSRALLHGLPQQSTIEVRVIAGVTGPEIDFNEIEIAGSWTQLQTGSPSPNEDIEALGDRDLLGGYRGGCLLSFCRGFMAAPLHSAHAERCRRCGNSYEEHLELEEDAAKAEEAPSEPVNQTQGEATEKEPSELEEADEKSGTASIAESPTEDEKEGPDADGQSDRASEDLDHVEGLQGPCEHADAEHAWEDFLHADEGEEDVEEAKEPAETLATVEEFLVATATEIRSAPSFFAPSIGNLELGAAVSGRLHNDWLNLCEPRETDTDSNKWVWLWNLERRGENVSCDLEQSERAALRAQQAVGGIAYQTFQTLPLYSRPSRSSILEDSRLPPGVSVTGFPAQ